MAEVIPQLDEQVDPGPRDAVGHFLFAWSQLSALGGAVLLFGACALSVYSVVGRWLFDAPVLGDVEMVQMWVVPDAAGVTPSYEQLDISTELDAGGLVLVASGVPGHEDDAAIRIRNRYATLWTARLQPGASVHLPAAPWVHLYVPRGSVDVEGVGLLSTGDAARCTDEPGRRVTAREASEVLVWEMLTSL